MSKTRRFLIALGICLSGWTLVPLVSLPRQAFGWEVYAGAYELIMQSGFENGFVGWSLVVPGGFRYFARNSSEEYTLLFALDRTALQAIEDDTVEVLVGTTREGEAVFRLAARPSQGGGFHVRLAARRGSGMVHTTWRWVGDDRPLLLEWRRSFANIGDGHLYLSAERELVLWLVDLDNDRWPLERIGVAPEVGQPWVVDLSGGRYGTVDTDE